MLRRFTTSAMTATSLSNPLQRSHILLRHLSTHSTASPQPLTFSQYPFLAQLGLQPHNAGVFTGRRWLKGSGPMFQSINPATNEVIATIQAGSVKDYEECVREMDSIKQDWSSLPVPVRGEMVRQIGEALRHNKQALGRLISLEMGKIEGEGLGEVQEAIDICDFAVGLSRSLNSSIIPSERPQHFMMERFLPLINHVAIITAFNFPCAVYFWNLALSLICGNTNLWKGSDSTCLTSIACTKIVSSVLSRQQRDYSAAAVMLCGRGDDVGEAIINDKCMELISFTGSTQVGRHVSEITSRRFAKRILELGGNNSMIVSEDADLALALRATLFAAVGTCGQRCTSLRRLYVHESIYNEFLVKLIKAYESVKIGNPLERGVLCGPMHNQRAVEMFVRGVQEAKAQGGQVLYGGAVLSDRPGNFVTPTLVSMSNPSAACIQHELFAPILYVMKFKTLQEAIRLNNSVPQGLSSSLFTRSQSAIFEWTGPNGSDCGIVNVNIGPSGAEIGGAFGGEKETGGGRESGSDAWKQYCRRATCTINYGKELPLAQGINFDNAAP